MLHYFVLRGRRLADSKNAPSWSVKKNRLSEATRNAVQCCKFRFFSVRWPFFQQNKIQRRRQLFFATFFFCLKKKVDEMTNSLNLYLQLPKAKRKPQIEKITIFAPEMPRHVHFESRHRQTILTVLFKPDLRSVFFLEIMY